jgi:hypothetical protein
MATATPVIARCVHEETVLADLARATLLTLRVPFNQLVAPVSGWS